MNHTTTWAEHINRTPDDVFSFVSNIENHEQWSPTAFKATKTSEGPIGVGTTYKTNGWLPGKGKEFENQVTVTAFDPGKRFGFESKYSEGPVPNDFVLSAEDGGTKIERTMTIPPPPGFQGFMWPVIFPMLVKPAIQKNLKLLKAKLEEPAA